ncbi:MULTISPECIES: hypothetical protein [Spirulina sp. CCY15215]|uniref:hypothetical protein n=1 Tax=Spirulina sp. CCY15215 TaxID=2767591 RepID=UPI00194E8693|nr:hypothetical protein [Spirulina major]
MTNSFKDLSKHFLNNEFGAIEDHDLGVRFLKLRSVSRKNTIKELCCLHNVETDGKRSNILFEEVFNNEVITEDHIDSYIKEKYDEERSSRREQEDYLIDQLNRLHAFNWGGSKGNSLEKNIVDNYVKKIKSYDQINEEIESNLLSSLRGYTLNSWYNHWTSILIEDIFKDNQNVLPTVGLIKKVDFFICNIPFDLKVTYFPEQLMKEKLRDCGYGNELTRTKKICRNLNIHIPDDLKNEALKSHLQGILKERQDQRARNFIDELNYQKIEIINSSMNNPNELKVWLYENQGEMRFDASNRFFLILVNNTNLSESWKIKRNIVFLREKINEHLETLVQDSDSLTTRFHWSKNDTWYECKSDILFINYQE